MALDDIYKEVILDHYKNPRNKRELAGAERSNHQNNPLCGDEITVYVNTEGDAIAEVTFQGAGCSISQSSASMMTEAIKGKTRSEIETLTQQFRDMMSLDGETEIELDPDRPGAVLGDLESLQGVRKYPVRIKCASLGWNVLLEALGESG